MPLGGHRAPLGRHSQVTPSHDTASLFYAGGDARRHAVGRVQLLSREVVLTCKGGLEGSLLAWGLGGAVWEEQGLRESPSLLLKRWGVTPDSVEIHRGSPCIQFAQLLTEGSPSPVPERILGSVTNPTALLSSLGAALYLAELGGARTRGLGREDAQGSLSVGSGTLQGARGLNLGSSALPLVLSLLLQIQLLSQGI